MVEPETRVLCLHIELNDIEPPIWRDLEIPAQATFWDLHVAIQDAMGWSDSHLHAFHPDEGVEGRVVIGLPDPDGGGDGHLPGWEVLLERFLRAKGDGVLYVYDFGDNWEHLVEVSAVKAAAPTTKYPRCTGGERACPPEDVGGPLRYQEIVETLADGDELDEDLRDWMPEDFDPDEFNFQAIRFTSAKDRLKKFLARR